jgi:hypothetical protein
LVDVQFERVEFAGGFIDFRKPSTKKKRDDREGMGDGSKYV